MASNAPTSQPTDRRGGPGTHLFRSFIVISVIAIAAILIVSGLGLRMVLRDHVVREAQKDAIRVSGAVRDWKVRDFIRHEQGRAPALVVPPDKMPALDRQMRILLASFNVVKIKVFDVETEIVYSTDPKIIGKRSKDNAKLASALGGKAVSQYEHKDHVWDLDDESRLDVSVVETYVPIVDRSGEIVGSFEIYKDVTQDLAMAGDTLIRAEGVLLATLATVFAVLAAVMRVACRTIRDRSVKLMHSEEKYRQLFSIETDAILIFETQSKRLIDMNLAAETLYGLSRSDLPSLTIGSVLASPTCLDECILIPGSGQLRNVTRCDHKTVDGTVFSVEMSGRRFRADDTEMMFLVVRDVTHRKQAEDELVATIQELERFNRLAVGREERMIELKREVNELARKAGVAPPCDLNFAETGSAALRSDACGNERGGARR